ncbi:Hypothetical predicted protein, partial [Pelobates cultripes]
MEIYTTPSSTKFNRSVSINLTTASKLSREAASTAAMDSEIWHNDISQSLEPKLRRTVALPNHYPQETSHSSSSEIPHGGAKRNQLPLSEPLGLPESG